MEEIRDAGVEEKEAATKAEEGGKLKGTWKFPTNRRRNEARWSKNNQWWWSIQNQKKGKGPITRKNMNAYENRIVNTLEYDNPDYKLKKCDV